jgi:hypothetical protein
VDLSWGHLRALTPPLRRPKYELAVCAIFKNEAPYLREWVGFHQAQGVGRFWLYDNRSTNDWQTALQGFDGVEVTDWPAVPGQFSAYSDCLKRHRTDARWIAFIDLDEFLYSPTGRSLTDVLRRFSGVSGVAVNWRVYGHNGYTERPAGPVLENYTWRASDHHPSNRHVKTIANPRKTSTWVENPHFFRHYGTPVGENHDPVTSPFRSPPTASLLRINHYCLKSLADIEWRAGRLRADGLRVWGRDEVLVPPSEVRDPLAQRGSPANLGV